MANVCTFEMRVKGTPDNCNRLFESMTNCYEAYVVDSRVIGEEELYQVEGECRWSVTGSLINSNHDGTFNTKSLAEKSSILNLELEIFGYDKSEPEWVEHYHYKNGKCLKAFNLPSDFPEWMIDEIELSETDLEKYRYIEEHGIYVLKKEFNEDFKWVPNEFDEWDGEMIVQWIMPAVQ